MSSVASRLASLAAMRVPSQPVNCTRSGTWESCRSATAEGTFSGTGVIGPAMALTPISATAKMPRLTDISLTLGVFVLSRISVQPFAFSDLDCLRRPTRSLANEADEMPTMRSGTCSRRRGGQPSRQRLYPQPHSLATQSPPGLRLLEQAANAIKSEWAWVGRSAVSASNRNRSFDGSFLR